MSRKDSGDVSAAIRGGAYRVAPAKSLRELCEAEAARARMSGDALSGRPTRWENRYPLPANYIPIIRQQIFRSASYLRLRGDRGERAAYNQAVGWHVSRLWPRVGPKLGWRSDNYSVAE